MLQLSAMVFGESYHGVPVPFSLVHHLLLWEMEHPLGPPTKYNQLVSYMVHHILACSFFQDFWSTICHSTSGIFTFLDSRHHFLHASQNHSNNMLAPSPGGCQILYHRRMHLYKFSHIRLYALSSLIQHLQMTLPHTCTLWIYNLPRFGCNFCHLSALL